MYRRVVYFWSRRNLTEDQTSVNHSFSSRAFEAAFDSSFPGQGTDERHEITTSEIILRPYYASRAIFLLFDILAVVMQFTVTYFLSQKSLDSLFQWDWSIPTELGNSRRDAFMYNRWSVASLLSVDLEYCTTSRFSINGYIWNCEIEMSVFTISAMVPVAVGVFWFSFQNVTKRVV